LAKNFLIIVEIATDVVDRRCAEIKNKIFFALFYFF